MKRLRVTKKGKILARASGQNHFNAKNSGSATMKHKRSTHFHGIMNNTAKSRFLS